MELVLLGKITKLRGVHGEFKILCSTYFSNERYRKGNTIYFSNDDGNTTIPLTVKSHHLSGKFDFVTTEEILDANEAQKYVNFSVYAAKGDLKLEKNTYFFADLENCEVINQNGQKIGKVLAVEEFPAQITLRVIKSDKNTFFVPFVDDFIINVDIDNHIIQINVIEGMLE